MSKKRTPTEKAKTGANLFDVLIKLIDAVYNLTNSGNIVGVILLYFCAQVFYITQKLSTEALDKYLGKLFALDYFYIYPLGGALALSLAANYYQARVYRRHIETLVQTRRELIHGLQTGELKTLKQHGTSGIDSLEHADDC
ncbi:MAG: hypothetical protein ABSB19_18700 [Methylomonas sp.]